MYDYSDENLISEQSEYDRHYHVSKVLGRRRTAPTDVYANWHPVEGFKRRWTTVEDMGRLVFEDSGTDMAMAQAVPLFDLYKDGFAPVKAQYAFAQAYPERCLFCGAVDPDVPERGRRVRGDGAPGEGVGSEIASKSTTPTWTGNPGRATTPEIAYPLYEKGCANCISSAPYSSSTRETPFTRAKLRDLSPLDIEGAALDFPDMLFGVHHLAVPYFEEVVWMANRYENVFLVLSGIGHTPMIAPRTFTVKDKKDCCAT